MKVGVSRTSTLIPSEKGLVLKMLDFKSLHYQLNDSHIRLLYIQHKNFNYCICSMKRSERFLNFGP